MKSIVLLVCALAIIVSLPAQAIVVWEDNFDSYPVGGLIGNGNWEGWDDNPAADARVTNAISRSAPNSVEIISTADVIQQFSGATSGQWIISAWVYVPDDLTGATYFLLLNTYSHGGANNNWSTQIKFENGLVESEFDGVTLPIVFNQWVEMRVEIDLDADTQMIFYDNQMMILKSWTDGNSGGGALNIACVDLFSNGASSVFWDDMKLEELGATPVAVKTWGGVKEMFR